MHRAAALHAPEPIGGHPVWSATQGEVEARFVGRGPIASRRGLCETVAPAGVELAWLTQIHSSKVVEARPGGCGEGDALITRRRGLALAVGTADCVPVLLGNEKEVAAVHAGWRGIVAGVVGETLAAMASDPRGLTAWIGPAIGPCCYEVAPEVAARIAGASAAEVAVEGAGSRPHADLPAAVAWQLRAGGVTDLRTVEHCTRCHPEELWSFRRDGPGGGRNLAFVWLRG